MRFPSLFRVIRGRKVVDRGQGVSPSFRPVPVDSTLGEMNHLIDERFGISHCPNCGLKVGVLVNGVCRDCSPDVA